MKGGKYMYYWDNAATTWPKPQPVREAMAAALMRFGANPGRGGHQMAYATSEAVFQCRKTAAAFFGLSEPDNVIFTLNCTMALNMVIKGILRSGGRAVISDVEHNAVVRPLFALTGSERAFTTVPICIENPAVTVENFRRAITPDTRLIICTHASNVWGTVQPIREIGALARRLQIPFAVDAAQSAGVMPIDMEKDNIDFLCVPGHKGLYGPMGIGMLLTSGKYPLPSFVEGGTGSRSMDLHQPTDLPDHLESGTPNTAGICGLNAGMQWVERQAIERIGRQETAHLQTVYRVLQNIPQIRLYTPYPEWGRQAPVLSFNIDHVPSEKAAALLNASGVAVRAGLHCAPLAHRKMHTESTGTVRLAPSAFTTDTETGKICKIIRQTVQKSLQRERGHDIVYNT